MPSSVSQAGRGTPGWTHGSGGSGDAGLAGQTGQVGPGRARAGLAGRLGAIIQIVQIIGFLDQLLKIQPGSKLLVKLGPREGNPKLLLFLENAPYCPIIFGPKNSNNIAKIPIIQEANYWSKNSNNIAKIPIIQLPNYWSIIGPNY